MIKRLNKKAETSLLTIVFSALLIMLFTVSIFYYAIGMQNANNAPNDTKLENQPLISNTKTSMDNAINENNKNFGNIKKAFESDTPNILSFTLILTSIIGVGRGLGFMIIGGFDLTFGLVFKGIFGGTTDGNPFYILFIVVTMMILIAVVIFAWRLYRQGS